MTPEVIHDAMQFPIDWEIKSIETEVSLGGYIYLMAVITGPEFPSLTKDGVKECMIDVTKEQIKYKVRVI